ncbi:MAG TPA: thioredoxin family protein [Candidatus Kryptonia bacterium]|nr:thioredoxin family protein [Candidatus Kryptonia bacterium]
MCLTIVGARTAWAHDWNDAQIQWQSYENGLAAAKATKKPICLIFYTDWCPHCKNYSGVFHDPKVVEQAKKFVMIRLNGDEKKELSQEYAPDGQYIPRTFFLSSNGVLADTIQLPRDRFKYFYDEQSPAGILAGMDEALKKLK